MDRKVLVPLDGSELAECALSHIKDFVKDGLAGEVTLITILRVDLPWAEAHDEHFNINVLRENIFAASEKYLANVASRLGSEGIKVKTVSIEANNPAEAITEYARKNAMDMIVIATHGRTGMKKMLLGSVALGILHQSHVPVHLIRPEACR